MIANDVRSTEILRHGAYVCLKLPAALRPALARAAVPALAARLGLSSEFEPGGDHPPDWQVLHVLSTAGASILAVGYLLPMIYLLYSLRFGEVAGDNPWGATSLEWQTTSPPPLHNFEVTPVVTEEAYHYSKDREAAFV